MHRRFLPFWAVALAVATTVLLGHPVPSASAPIPEPGGMMARSSYIRGSFITAITTDTISIPTYPYAAHLYTATNTTYNIPYRWLNWAEYNGSHPQPVDQTYTRLTLENEWLRVSLLPQLGGRVYELIYKPTGNDELYRNTVIKPTHWGPSEQGWWLAAGGLEWGLPVEEHGYESAVPWTYDVITGAGGITVTLRDSTQPDRLRATVSVFLPGDRAVLIVRPRLENDRSVPLDFKWWDNAMLAPGPGNSVGKQANNPNGTDLKFVFPESQVTVHSTGDPTLPQAGQAMSWPIYNSRDLSRLQNWNQWLGFFARPAASQNWVSVIDQAHQEGVVRIFPRSIAQGSKGFAMGWQHPIGAGEWTDDDSYYVELHGGLAPTFWDSVSLGAHQAIEWEETWYPIAGVNDLASATGEAALHIEQTGAQLNMTVYSTRSHDHARLAVYQRQNDIGVLMADYDLASIVPGTPVVRSSSTAALPQDVRIIFTADDSLLAAYNLTNDGRAPATSITMLPPYVTQGTFSVQWDAVDSDGVRSYDVQVKDGLYGAWTPWLTATTQTTSNFSGLNGHTYFFRVRARDLSGNQSQFNLDQHGDAFTSVLITPAPVFETSFKWTWPFFKPDVPLTYTVFINNTGSLSAVLTLTDTLPPSTALVPDTLSIDAGPAPTFDGAASHWTGSVTGSSTYLRLTYALTPSLSLVPGTVLTNIMQMHFGTSTILRTATTVSGFDVYLPVIFRNAP